MSEENRRHSLIELGDANEMARAAVTSAPAAAPAAVADAPLRESVSARFMHAIFHHDHNEVEEDADLPAYDDPFPHCIIVTLWPGTTTPKSRPCWRRSRAP